MHFFLFSAFGSDSCSSATGSYTKDIYECYCSENLPRLPVMASISKVAPATSSSTQLPVSNRLSKQTLLTSASAPAANPLKRQQSDLSKWLVQDNPGGKSSSKFRSSSKPTLNRWAGFPKKGVCGGRVYVMSVDDESHRLGRQCLGQRIVVVIDHGPQR